MCRFLTCLWAFLTFKSLLPWVRRRNTSAGLLGAGMEQTSAVFQREKSLCFMMHSRLLSEGDPHHYMAAAPDYMLMTTWALREAPSSECRACRRIVAASALGRTWRWTSWLAAWSVFQSWCAVMIGDWSSNVHTFKGLCCSNDPMTALEPNDCWCFMKSFLLMKSSVFHFPLFTLRSGLLSGSTVMQFSRIKIRS